MLTLLYGRPGSGKTAYMIDAVKRSVGSGKKTYFLVPEQQAFVSECMLADLPPAAVLSFEVVSFSRLCEIAFSEYGGLTDTSAGAGIRNLLMWQNLRELSGFLKAYGNTPPDRALTEMMLSMTDELKAGTVPPEACEEAAKRCEGDLADKMQDIALVYANFERLLSERLGEAAILAENKLQRLAALLETAPAFSGCAFYVDSFVSFTGEEHAVLERLMCRADEFCISFCTDTRKPRIYTESVCDTAKRICHFARRQDLPFRQVKLTENTRTASSELQLLERHLWDFSLKKQEIPHIPPEARGSIEMAICQNEYEEAFFAALEILKAKQAGLKYSEMALIMHDCESRKGIIDAVFEHAGIPYFYSERTDLSATAPARLVLSALRCIAFNFRSADVLTLLKTGLSGIDPHDADLFEDYCTVWSIEGAKFTDEKTPWSMNPDGYTVERSPRGDGILSAANRVKSRLIPPLLELRKRLIAAEGNAVEACRALYAYLEDIRLSESLSTLAELLLSMGELREAGELLRVYDCIVSALTEIATIMAADRFSAEELADALEIMLANTDLGSVPAVGDYVTVGSAATLRVENMKIAILLGLCEGEFPKGYSDAGLLTESDKQKLEEISFPLESREYRITSDELFHVHRAMTRPSEKLILSTITSRIGGGTLSPSSAWNRVLYLFDYIKPKNFYLSRIRSIAEAMAEAEDDTAQLPSALTVSDTPEDSEATVKIDPSYVRMLFGDKLRLTKSRISAFVECPYKYWCDYVLDLRETTPARVSFSDAGTIIHFVLERLVKERMDGEGRLLPLPAEQLIHDVDRILGDYIKDISCPLPPSMMYSFSRIRDLSLVMAKSILEEFQASDLRVLALEKRVSDRGEDALHPMEIKIGEAEDSPIVSLGGVIDRIDCLDSEEGRFLRIIDYKTGNKRFDLGKVASGADLQLPAYLFTAALEENARLLGSPRHAFPASALYLSAGEESGRIVPLRSGFLLGEACYMRGASRDNDKRLLAGAYFKKDGELHAGSAAVSRDGIARIKETLCSTIATTAHSMYSGLAPRTPSEDACTYCRMRASCPVAYKSKK